VYPVNSPFRDTTPDPSAPMTEFIPMEIGARDALPCLVLSCPPSQRGRELEGGRIGDSHVLCEVATSSIPLSHHLPEKRKSHYCRAELDSASVPNASNTQTSQHQSTSALVTPRDRCAVNERLLRVTQILNQVQHDNTSQSRRKALNPRRRHHDVVVRVA
jgi:hypothetical protein